MAGSGLAGYTRLQDLQVGEGYAQLQAGLRLEVATSQVAGSSGRGTSTRAVGGALMIELRALAAAPAGATAGVLVAAGADALAAAARIATSRGYGAERAGLVLQPALRGGLLLRLPLGSSGVALVGEGGAQLRPIRIGFRFADGRSEDVRVRGDYLAPWAAVGVAVGAP
jgi:hypothetical protein